jgi:tape measure domain-containing protein
MAGTSVGNVSATATLDASGFAAGAAQMVAGAQQIQSAMSGIDSSVSSASSSLASSFGAGVGNFFTDIISGAGSAVGAIGDFVSGFLEIPGAILGAVQSVSEFIFFVSEAASRLMDLANSVFDAASSWQQFTVQLSAFTGSAASANIMMEQLHQFALTTPFDLPGVVSAGEKLLAMGTAAQDVIPTLQAVAGAVYATGGDTSKMELVINLLNRMGETGKMTLLSMNTLIRAGIPAWDILASALGTDVAGAMDKVKSGALSASDGVALLLEGMRQMGDPALAQFGTTWAGAVNNMQGAFEDLWRTLTMPVMQAVTLDVNGLAAALQSPAFTDFASSVGTGIATAISSIGTAFSNLQTWLEPVTTAIGDFMARLSDAASGADFANLLADLEHAFQLIGVVIAPLPTLIAGFITSLDPGAIASFIDSGINLLVQAFQGIMQWLAPVGDAISGLLAQFSDTGTLSAAASLWDTLGQTFQMIGTVLAPVRDLLVSFISSIDVSAILSFVDGIVGFANAVGTQLAPILTGVVSLIEQVGTALGSIVADIAGSGAFQLLGQSFLDLLAVMGPLVQNLADFAGAIASVVAESGLVQGAFEGILVALGLVSVGLTLVITGFNGLVAIIRAVADGSAFTESGLARLGDQLMAIGQQGLNAVNNFQMLTSSMQSIGTNSGIPGASAQMDTFIGRIQIANQETQNLNGTWITLDGTVNRIQMPANFQYSIAQSRVAVDDLDRAMGMLGIAPYTINLNYASITTAHTEVDSLYMGLDSLGQMHAINLNYASITTAHTEIDALGQGLDYLGAPRNINLGYASITTAHTEIDALGQGLDYLGSPRQINLGYASITTAHTEIDSLDAALTNLGAPHQINLGYASITSAHTEVDTLQNALNTMAKTVYSPQVNIGSITAAGAAASAARALLMTLTGPFTPIVPLGSITAAGAAASAAHAQMMTMNATFTPIVPTGSITAAGAAAVTTHSQLMTLNGTSTWTANLVGGALGAAGVHSSLMALNGSSTWTANLINTTTNVVNTVVNPPTTLMAEGGIINEPIVGYGTQSGTRYVMGESGPEEVVPLSGGGGSSRRGGASSGAPSQLIIQVSGTDWGRELARAMASLVVSEIRLDVA